MTTARCEPSRAWSCRSPASPSAPSKCSLRLRLDRALFLDVAVRFLYAETGGSQPFADFTRDQHAAVVPPGAAERYRQVALALRDIVRQQIDQQLRDTLDELGGLRERTNVAGHARMLAAKVLEGRNVVGIGQKPHVEHQVALGGHSVAVAEAGYLHQDIRRSLLPSESPVNGFAQLMHIEFRGVDDGVRQLADRLQALPLAADAGADALLGAERVRPPGFTEAP